MIVGQRQRHRDLAIVLLALLAAVLARDTDRVAPLLGDPGIVHDPGCDRTVALKCRHNVPVDRFQQSAITPRSLGNEVMQRLMLCLNVLGIKARRHRFDALAFAVEQQAEAIGPKRVLTVGMTQSCGKFIQIRVQALLSTALTMFNTVLNHAPYIGILCLTMLPI